MKKPFKAITQVLVVNWREIQGMVNRKFKKKYHHAYIRDIWNGHHVSTTLLKYLEEIIGEVSPATKKFEQDLIQKSVK
jgi:hypothetical protein